MLFPILKIDSHKSGLKASSYSASCILRSINVRWGISKNLRDLILSLLASGMSNSSSRWPQVRNQAITPAGRRNQLEMRKLISF